MPKRPNRPADETKKVWSRRLAEVVTLPKRPVVLSLGWSREMLLVVTDAVASRIGQLNVNSAAVLAKVIVRVLL